MAEVNAETVPLLAVEEATQGTSPTSGWFGVEYDSMSGAGGTYTKQARTPFSPSRMRRRPFVSGLDVGLSLEMDATWDNVYNFGEAIYKSTWKNSGGNGVAVHRPTAVVSDGFTVASNGALTDGTLVAAYGFDNPENNGLHVVASAGAAKIGVSSTLVAETNPSNAIVIVVGFQFAAGDLELDSDGNLTTTTKNLTQLGLNRWQWVYIGGPDDVDPPYRFGDATYYGFAQIALTPATNKLTLRRRDWTPGAGTTETTTTIRLFYTAWIRNVPRLHADEKLVSHSFEIGYPGLPGAGLTAYEYMRGMMLNQVTFTVPAEGKITMSMDFIGQTATDPTETRVTGPSTARDPVSELALSTSADIKRLSVEETDESGLLTDFEDVSIVVGNNITPHDAVGYLGNRFTPLGVFQVDVTANVYFTSADIVTAVRDNRVLRMSQGARNTEFGVLIDVPSMGELAAPKTFTHNELVRIGTTLADFQDPVAGFSAGMSLFGYLPTQAPGLET